MWVTGYGLTCPANRKAKYPVTVQFISLSQLVLSIYHNPEEVGSNANEGMDLLGREGRNRDTYVHTYIHTYIHTERERARASFFYVLYTGCQQKVWSKLKVGLSTTKI